MNNMSNMNIHYNFQRDFTGTLPSKMIIDIGGGIQDVVALISALQILQITSSKAEVIGIVCTNGRNNVQRASKFAIAANNISKTKIPIFLGTYAGNSGQKESLMRKKQFTIGQLDQKFEALSDHVINNFTSPEDKVQISDKKATDFYIESAHEYGKQLGIVVFGPPTTLALACVLDRSISPLIGMVSAYGGQYLGIGDTVHNTEQNFSFDPESADLLLQHFKERLYILPRDKALNTNWKNCFESLIGKKDEEKYILSEMKKESEKHLFLGQLLTILPLLVKQIVKNEYFLFSDIVRDSGQYDGLLALRWIPIGKAQKNCDPNIRIYENFNLELCESLLKKVFNP